jgi:hypothetical protein
MTPMPIYPPREPLVDPAVRRTGRLGVLFLVLVTAAAAVIDGYVIYKAFIGP